MIDEEITEWLLKGVERCSLMAMELVHGRSRELPGTRGMYVLTSRAWVEEAQRRENTWYEQPQQYSQPPMKKPKVKRKRSIKPEPEETPADAKVEPVETPRCEGRKNGTAGRTG